MESGRGTGADCAPWVGQQLGGEDSGSPALSILHVYFRLWLCDQFSVWLCLVPSLLKIKIDKEQRKLLMSKIEMIL